MSAIPVIAIANLFDRQPFSGSPYQSNRDRGVLWAMLNGLSSGANEQVVSGFMNTPGRTVQPFMISSTLHGGHGYVIYQLCHWGKLKNLHHGDVRRDAIRTVILLHWAVKNVNVRGPTNGTAKRALTCW